MWHLTAYKFSFSLSFFNWIKDKMIFYRISELLWLTLIQRYDKKQQQQQKKKKKKKNNHF